MMKQGKGLTNHIVIDKERLKLSHGWPSQIQVSGTNQLMNAVWPGCR